MSNVKRHIGYPYLPIEKVVSGLTRIIKLLTQVGVTSLRFCLLHWKEVAVTFYGSLMIGLWLFVAYNKITDFDQNMEGMLRQPFPERLAVFLAYAVPGSELIAALLIGYHRTRLVGLAFSALLMTVFTAYVGLAILHVWSDQLPCNCGLIIPIGWRDHFVFNVFLLLISCWGFVLQWWILKSKFNPNSNHKTYRYKITQSIPILRNGKGKAHNGLKRSHTHTKE